MSMLDHNAGDTVSGEASPRRLWRWVRVALAAVCLLGAVLLVTWQVVWRPDASALQYSPAHPPLALPAAYYVMVEGQIAQGLSLSVAAITAGIEAEPNEGLFGVALTQRVGGDQLYTIEIAALQVASDQLAANGQWTQAQDDTTMQFWRARGSKALGADMTDWFLRH